MAVSEKHGRRVNIPASLWASERKRALSFLWLSLVHSDVSFLRQVCTQGDSGLSLRKKKKLIFRFLYYGMFASGLLKGSRVCPGILNWNEGHSRDTHIFVFSSLGKRTGWLLENNLCTTPTPRPPPFSPRSRHAPQDFAGFLHLCRSCVKPERPLQPRSCHLF